MKRMKTMFKKCLSQVSLLGMSLVLMVLVSVVASKPTLGASFALPLPTPSDLATSPFNWLLPSPVIEAQARIALEYIARHESIPLVELAQDVGGHSCPMELSCSTYRLIDECP